MTQAEVYEFLCLNKGRRFKPLTIRLNLGLKEPALFNNLRRLKQHGDIQYDNGKYWVE